MKMQSIMIFFGAIFLLANPSCSKKPNSPSIRIETTNFDCGVINRNERVAVHAFKLTNTGGKTLNIEKVKTSCSCTAVKFSDEILPGESGYVQLRFTLENRLGTQTTSAVVFTNDPAKPETILSLQAQVNASFDINIDKIRLSKVRAGDICQEEFKIIIPENISDTNPIFTVKDPRVEIVRVCQETKYTQWSEQVLILTYRVLYDTNDYVGPIDSVVLIDVGEQARELKISGEIEGEIVVSPKSFYYDEIKVGEKKTGSFDVLGVKDISQARSVNVSSSSISILSKSYHENKLTVKFCVKPQVADELFFRETISILMEDPIQPEVSVDILGVMSEE